MCSQDEAGSEQFFAVIVAVIPSDLLVSGKVQFIIARGQRPPTMGSTHTTACERRSLAQGQPQGRPVCAETWQADSALGL